MLIATYQMPPFTTRQEAIDMAKPHGMTIKSFSSGSATDGDHKAVFFAPSRAQIDGFSAAVSYGPESVTEPRDITDKVGPVTDAEIESLRPVHQSLMRRSLAGDSYVTIAEEMQMQVGTVRSGLNRARNAILKMREAAPRQQAAE